jgi:NADH-quinone oxidoreductase subunit H
MGRAAARQSSARGYPGLITILFLMDLHSFLFQISLPMAGQWAPATEATVIPIIVSVVKIAIVIGITLGLVAYVVLAERRLAAAIQDRIGPNRTGIPFTGIKLQGLLQPMADGLKFVLKEQFIPAHVEKLYFIIAPSLALMPPLITIAVIPFASTAPLTLPWWDIPIEHPGVIANINVGILFIFAVTSLSVYGIVLAGWASNSKYSFLGGIRSSAQMISYEVSLGLSVIPVFLMVGDLNLSRVVEYQAQFGWFALPSFAWMPGYFGGKAEFWPVLLAHFVLWPSMFLCFFVFLVSAFAETNRLPFDLPESETELVGGYHTEYAGMRFALFFLGEYAAMIVTSSLMVTLFLGGWTLPIPALNTVDGVGGGWLGLGSWSGFVLQVLTFGVKMLAIIFLFIWVRWTLPRFRYDQLMQLGWKVFLPVALLNIMVVAALMALFRSGLR